MKGSRTAYCVLLYTHKWCAHAFEQARGGSGAWYAMELTKLLPHVARGLNIKWSEASQHGGLARADETLPWMPYLPPMEARIAPTSSASLSMSAWVIAVDRQPTRCGATMAPRARRASYTRARPPRSRSDPSHARK